MRSTISGIILDVPVKVGNSVILSNTFNDGTTIASVADMSNLIFRGNIDETEVGRLSVGMPMEITIGALQDLRFSASLEYISPKATATTGGANQFEIKAAVNVPAPVVAPEGSSQDEAAKASAASASSLIRSGYSATAKIVLEKADHVLTIPEAAIEFSGDSTFVYVLQNPAAKEPTYERRQVQTGLSDGINIEVRSGLKADESVRGSMIIADDKKNKD